MKIEGWLRRLEGERLEVLLKTVDVGDLPDRKIRASGPFDEMVELVQWFEDKTGMRVTHPILPKRAPKPIEGQMELAMGELPSHDATLSGHDPS